MLPTVRSQRVIAALAAALLAAALGAGVALAHPASEGEHPSGCIVTVDPGSVPVGGQFTVAGNFTGASIFLVRGAGASPAEGAQPNATTPQSGSGFSVTFTAEAGDVGDWTVWGILPESECGDSDRLTVTAAGVPNVAMPEPEPSVIGAIGSALLISGVAVAAMVILRRTARR